MTDDSSLPSPPEGLPADLRLALKDHATDVHALQETILYAQEMLNRLHESALPIEPIEGEDILKVEEHPGYIEVVKRFEEGENAYLYHVQREPEIDGEEQLQWTLIGRIKTDVS